MRQLDRIVIVGAGLAGLRAAERLRELGFAGEVTMLGEERHRPYSRTPLSKELLTGELQPRDVKLQCFGAELDVVWRLATPAIGLDPHAQTVRLRSGEDLEYDGLIVATGVEPRHLSGAPLHSPRVCMLRTIDDCVEIDRLLSQARHVGIVGGGFIGCEIASTVRERALGATIIDVSPTILTRGLGRQLGAIAGDIHRDAGVRLHLGVGVASWESDDESVTIVLEDDERVRCDAAIVGIGTMPCTGWLEGCGIDVSDGVLCDATCHVEGLDNIVAAGDVARWPNLRFDSVPRRVEHWIHATEQARAAAENLLIGREQALPFMPIPRFWSHQHGVRIQSVGMPALATDVDMHVVEGSVSDRRFLAEFRSGDQLVGAIGFDAPRAIADRYARLDSTTAAVLDSMSHA